MTIIKAVHQLEGAAAGRVVEAATIT